MPFTFSHPAAILPFACLPRKWFSLTGLVIGSLTPATIFSLFHNGEFITTDVSVCMDSRFDKII